MNEAVQRVESFIEQGGPRRYFAVNIHKIVTCRHSPEMHRIANHSDLVTADGQPILWASRWFGRPLKGRVNGTDLMERLVDLAARRQYGVYLLGAQDEVLQAMIKQYRQRFPDLRVVGSRNGYWSNEEESSVVSAIREARPDILFVGISSPRKELFMDRNLTQMQVPFAMGVGGSFDVAAGVTQRAPLWMQRTGLEWFWRVLQEPGRMWKRYLLDGIQFGFIVIRALVSGAD
ncbi:MAG TPA: WecB/TagA/CpsF family glycosyltransferase [Candidatus Angelobacter sp.]|nr:WecB/TagA/CpsF family glycosyltransferase [Candidatus Angelobacter sp.]